MDDKPGTQNNNTNLKQLKIELPPPPPDYIYKYRLNRERPEEEINNGRDSVTFIPERLEFIEGKGNFVHYYGLNIPSETVCPPANVYAVTPIKRRLINTIKFLTSKELRLPLVALFFIGKKRRTALLNRLLEMFVSEAWVTAQPYYLKDGYYCSFVKELRKFIQTFLVEMGGEEHLSDQAAETIGLCIENDNAYRWPAQDIFAEASQEELINNGPRELDRLVNIFASRVDYDPYTNKFLTDKMKSVAKLFKYVWKIPKLRKAFQNAVKGMDFSKLNLSEEMKFHTLLYRGYNVQGKTVEERTSEYMAYIGPNPEKYPLRVVVKSNY